MRRLTSFFGLVVLVYVLGSPVNAGEPPEKFEPGSRIKLNFLFPSVSEIYTALEARGLTFDVGAEELVITIPEWSKLSDRQKRMHLGSLLGYLTIAAAAEDTSALVTCLEGIIEGSKAVGIPEDSNSQEAMRNAVEKVKTGVMSKVKLLALLDDLRREGLRDASANLDDTSMATILAGAWLRGGILIARRVASDSEVNALSDLLARPELIRFVVDLTHDQEVEIPPEEASAIKELMTLAKKQSLTKTDMNRFSALAEKLLS